MNTLQGLTVVVGGACGTLGRAICEALGFAGANIILNDVNAEALEQLQEILRGRRYPVAIADQSASDSDQIIKDAVHQFGHIHAIINAQLGKIPWKPFEELTDQDFQVMFEANVQAPLRLIRAAWPYFKAQKFGRVVNFTSDSIIGMPTASAYTMTKGALFGLNKTLALEGAAHNIKINCVSPIAPKQSTTMSQAISYFSDNVKNAFRTVYTPEANVPMILSLISDKCEVSGEVFQTAGWGVGRSVWGTVEGESDMKDVESCLAMVHGLSKKNSKEVFEPTSMMDFTEFQAAYVLRKDS